MIPIDPVADIKLPKEEPGEIPDEKIMQNKKMKNVLVYMTLIVSLKAARIPGIMNSFYSSSYRITYRGSTCLEWCDLDFKHEKLRVYKNLKQSYKILWFERKWTSWKVFYYSDYNTKEKSASNRKVPLTDAVIAAFMSWKENRIVIKKTGEKLGKTKYTFKKISRSDFYNIFRKLSSIISSNRMQADCWDC